MRGFYIFGFVSFLLLQGNKQSLAQNNAYPYRVVILDTAKNPTIQLWALPYNYALPEVSSYEQGRFHDAHQQLDSVPYDLKAVNKSGLIQSNSHYSYYSDLLDYNERTFELRLQQSVTQRGLQQIQQEVYQDTIEKKIYWDLKVYVNSQLDTKTSTRHITIQLKEPLLGYTFILNQEIMESSLPPSEPQNCTHSREGVITDSTDIRLRQLKFTPLWDWGKEWLWTGTVVTDCVGHVLARAPYYDSVTNIVIVNIDNIDEERCAGLRWVDVQVPIKKINETFGVIMKEHLWSSLEDYDNAKIRQKK